MSNHKSTCIRYITRYIKYQTFIFSLQMVYKPVLRETVAVNAAVVLLLRLWLVGL